MDHLPRDMGPYYIVTLSLLPIIFWFLLCIFSCKRLFWGYVLIFFIDSCSLNSCNFGVPMRGGELRVFLPCHLCLYLCYLLFKANQKGGRVCVYVCVYLTSSLCAFSTFYYENFKHIQKFSVINLMYPSLSFNNYQKMAHLGTSLVVQWLRICLPHIQ